MAVKLFSIFNLECFLLAGTFLASSLLPLNSYSQNIKDKENKDIKSTEQRTWHAEDICFDSPSDTSQYITEDLLEGISEKPKTLEDKLKVYPNPSSGVFNLTAGHAINGVVSIEAKVFDLTGHAVSQYHGEGFYSAGMPFQIDLTSFPDGVYFIEVSTDGALFYLKAIKI